MACPQRNQIQVHYHFRLHCNGYKFCVLWFPDIRCHKTKLENKNLNKDVFREQDAISGWPSLLSGTHSRRDIDQSIGIQWWYDTQNNDPDAKRLILVTKGHLKQTFGWSRQDWLRSARVCEITTGGRQGAAVLSFPMSKANRERIIRTTHASYVWTNQHPSSTFDELLLEYLHTWWILFPRYHELKAFVLCVLKLSCVIIIRSCGWLLLCERPIKSTVCTFQANCAPHSSGFDSCVHFDNECCQTETFCTDCRKVREDRKSVV